MTAKTLHDIYDELGAATTLAEALGLIADGIVYGGHRQAGDAAGVVASWRRSCSTG